MSADSGNDIDASLLPNLSSIFLDLFPSKFEVTASARRRKLVALGMCAILMGSHPGESNPSRLDVDGQVFGKVGDWIGTWLDALGEIREKSTNDGGGGGASILRSGSPSLGASLLEDDFGNGDDDSGWLEDVSPGSARGRDLSEADLGIQVRLVDAVKAALQAAEGNAPAGTMNSVWQGMDPMVLDLLKKELEM